MADPTRATSELLNELLKPVKDLAYEIESFLEDRNDIITILYDVYTDKGSYEYCDESEITGMTYYELYNTVYNTDILPEINKYNLRENQIEKMLLPVQFDELMSHLPTIEGLCGEFEGNFETSIYDYTLEYEEIKNIIEHVLDPHLLD